MLPFCGLGVTVPISIKPNPSFDLSRLSTTIVEHFSEESQVYKLLKLWASDQYGNNLLEHEDTFDLYKLIAKNVKSAVPVKQLDKKIFSEFIIKKEEVPDDVILYRY